MKGTVQPWQEDVMPQKSKVIPAPAAQDFVAATDKPSSCSR